MYVDQDRRIDVSVDTNSVIAELIGGGVTAEDVIDFSSLVDQKELAFHGVKKFQLVEPILDEGIKPLTPEGGNISMWSGGSSLFGRPRNAFGTFDTSFFHYAHSYAPDLPGVSVMSLVVTSRQELENMGIEGYKPGSQFCLSKPLPRESITMFQVFDVENSARNSGSTLQAEMFNLLNVNLKNGFKLGEYISNYS